MADPNPTPVATPPAGSQPDRNGYVMTAIAAAIAALHLYLVTFTPISDLRIGALHFASFGFLCALHYSLAPRHARHPLIVALDYAAALLAVACVVYLFVMENALYARSVNFIASDWLFSIACVVLALEFVRRSVGWAIPLMVLAALGYAGGLGQYLPGVFHFPGLSAEVILYRSYFGPDGLFGSLARISYAYVFLFVIFGAFLASSGASDFIVNLARSATGRLRGGPGFVAVAASGMMGSISGSAAANVASTGTVTIPMMKRAGFRPEFAGGLETAASTGGQMMPPIMGAGAFVMANYTQIPYATIIGVALLPALLYLLSVACWIRINLQKYDIADIEDDTPRFLQVLAQGWMHLLPLIVLVGMLAADYTPEMAAVAGIASIVVVSWFTAQPIGPVRAIRTLAEASRTMIPTAVLLISIGIVVNMLGTTGIGNTFGLMIDSWSHGNVLIAIGLIGLVSLVLGMGLPVTASYIILATMAAPALSEMIVHGHLVSAIAGGDVPQQLVTMLQALGVAGADGLGQPMGHAAAATLVDQVPAPMMGQVSDQVLSAGVVTTALLSAHMIIFWLSQDSNVTPPVCIAAFAAAAIAGSRPFRTGFEAWKMAKGLYIIPLLFAFTPFLSGDVGTALAIFGWAAVGLYALAGGMSGYLESRLNIVERVLVLACGIGLLWPMPWYGHAVALVLFAIVFWRSRRRVQPGARAADQPQAGAPAGRRPV
ncbi:TRAP transporter fused permease subunit [Salinisphaera sp. T31B1]|uniref:TRAP transporter permease n=1 Tax=Salinisphaera sp. T31B1 TaxID=727963 RepID=UPI00333E9F43